MAQIDARIPLMAQPPQDNRLNTLASILQLKQGMDRNRLLQMQMEEEAAMRPLKRQQIQSALEKARMESDALKRKNNFFSPENIQQFQRPEYGAVAMPPDEVGGGPGRAQGPSRLDMPRFLEAGVTAGIVDPAKLEESRAKIAEQQANRERAYFQALTSSNDRQMAIEAANARHRELMETRQAEAAARAAQEKQRRDANLKPGERWGADGQTIEVIPGSAEWVRRSGLHSKDYQAVLGIDTKIGNASRKIEEILDPKNKVGFERNFGGYNALISQYSPDAQNMRMRIESLKSDLKGAGLELMRAGGSVGQMTVQEWPIVERMIDTIDPRLGEKEAAERLKSVKAYLEKIKNNAMDIYRTEWEKTQFYKPIGGGPGATEKVMSRADVEATARASGRTVDQVIEAARAKGFTVR